MKYASLNYTNKDLKKLLADNNIESHASSMIERYLQLFEANVLKREEVFPPKVKCKVGRPPKEEGKPATKPKREYFSHPTRTHPRRVIYTDIETLEVFTYDSMYKAIKARGHYCRFFARNNGQIVDGKYKLTVE